MPILFSLKSWEAVKSPYLFFLIYRDMCIVKVGNIIDGLINVITLGHGKDIAMWIANKLGYADCGCERRRVYLNGLFGCKEKRIEL